MGELLNDREKAERRYDEAMQQLRQHPSLIWTRNNFFLLVQSGLLAVAMGQSVEASLLERLLLPAAGLFIAGIWFWVIHAGQLLQRRWRALVMHFEKELFGPEGGAFLQAADQIQEGSATIVSITTALKILSGGFIALWLGLTLRAILSLA